MSLLSRIRQRLKSPARLRREAAAALAALAETEKAERARIDAEADAQARAALRYRAAFYDGGSLLLGTRTTRGTVQRHTSGEGAVWLEVTPGSKLIERAVRDGWIYLDDGTLLNAAHVAFIKITCGGTSGTAIQTHKASNNP